jgi:hypothetical protein
MKTLSHIAIASLAVAVTVMAMALALVEEDRVYTGFSYEDIGI